MRGVTGLKSAVLVGMCAAAVVPSAASAALVVYEPFSYNLSNGTNMNGVSATGDGLAGSWSGTDLVKYQTTGLSYGQLTVSDGAVWVDATGAANLLAGLSTDAKNAVTPTVGGGTKTVWMSFLLQRPDPQANTTASNYQGVGLQRDTGGTLLNHALVNNPGTTLAAKAGTATAANQAISPALALGETALVLAKFDFTRVSTNTRQVDLTAYLFRSGTVPTSEALSGGFQHQYRHRRQ